MEVLPASLAERLRELTYNERAVAYLHVDAALTLMGADGHLDNYGLAAVRLGEPVIEQVYFLEGLLPLEESSYFVPSVELDSGRAADLHFHQDGATVWVVLLDVTAARDAARQMQQKAYEMTLLQEKEVQLNRRLESLNRDLEAANDFLVTISTKISHYLAPQIYKSIFSGQKDVAIHTERKELTSSSPISRISPLPRSACSRRRSPSSSTSISPRCPQLPSSMAAPLINSSVTR